MPDVAIRFFLRKRRTDSHGCWRSLGMTCVIFVIS